MDQLGEGTEARVRTPLVECPPVECRQSDGATGALYREDRCNTPGVCHQLSNGFEHKHDMSSGNEGVNIKST